MLSDIATINAFLPSDRSEWERLWSSYLTFYNTSLDQDVYNSTWTQIISGLGPVYAIALREKNQQDTVVGFAHYLLQHSAWTVGKICYLQDLFIAPTHRRRGYASVLIHAVAEKAQQHHCEKLYWLTHEDNIGARILYNSIAKFNGFVRYDYNLG